MTTAVDDKTKREELISFIEQQKKKPGPFLHTSLTCFLPAFVIEQYWMKNSMEDLDFSGERVLVKETGAAPCTLHLNGSSKTDGLREPILKHLNLL